MDPVAFLQSLPVFRTLGDAGARALLDEATEVRFTPGDQIIERGAPGDSMYVIQRGAVRVPIEDDAHGRKFTAYLGPGDFFGEMALLTGEARAADVFADGEVDCVCWRLGKEATFALLKKDPRIARFLTEILGKRLLESGAMREVGKYKLMDELGRGGGAIVYEGYHPGLNRAVAIKMLSHELVYESDFKERFQNEARLVAELRHDNIVQVFDTDRAYATFFIVMEKLEGTELKTIVEDGPMTVEETKHILRQVARALQYAHKKGIVHQDIKPSNVFVETTGRVKLMDFGIAGAPVRRGGSSDDGVMGTPGYIAPEVLFQKSIDGRADIYALGLIGYEMLTGKPAFEHENKVELLRMQIGADRVELPDDSPADESLRAFVRKATAKDPEARFSTCGEILEHLDEMGTDGRAPSEAIAVTVLYPKGAKGEVEKRLGELSSSLDDIPGVRVLVGELTGDE